jgi:hypothetical protein
MCFLGAIGHHRIELVEFKKIIGATRSRFEVIEVAK